MPLQASPIWQHTGGGLVLQVGQRRDPVPAPIDDWLTGPGGVGLSTDAAYDLLRVERRLRHVITQLLEQVTCFDRRIAADRAAAGSDDQRQRKRRRRASRGDRALQAVLNERTELLETVEGARSLLQILRTFVIELDPPYGLLRAAAEGWRRGAEAPASVVMFDNEETFLDADPRRGTTGGWGGSNVAGIEQFGLGWRRDGDEDDPAQTAEEMPRAGPWQIGYIEPTAEIYAIRRCSYLSRQVWLLGTGFDTLRVVRDLMLPIMSRMTEPNSVVLVAGTVQANRMWHAQTSSQAARHRSAGHGFGGGVDPLGPVPDEAG